MSDDGNDAIWQRAEPDSPCVRICLLHPEAGICTGCYRTGDEIAAWPHLAPEARRALLAELPARAARLRRRRGRRRPAPPES